MGKGPRATAGHMPLTHYERTKKFVINNTVSDSADYGTTAVRLAGHSQYQIGTCALTTQTLLIQSTSSPTQGTSSTTENSTTSSGDSCVALCSPSGYLYEETSILEYLLIQTQQIRERQQRQEHIKRQEMNDATAKETKEKKRQLEEFEDSQRVIQKRQSQSEQAQAIDDLHRVSYWLSSAQPTASTTTTIAVSSVSQQVPNTPKLIKSDVANETTLTVTNGVDDTIVTSTTLPPVETISTTTATAGTIVDVPDRPLSPMTGQALSRRDLWPVRLEWTNRGSNHQLQQKVKCAISDRVISTGAPVVAYWTTKKPYSTSSSSSALDNNNNNNHSIGVVVLQSVYDTELGLNKCPNPKCPLTDRTIRHVRTIQRSGSSYAASGQCIMSAKQYKPTIT
jgi:hypothetical protein